MNTERPHEGARELFSYQLTERPLEQVVVEWEFRAHPGEEWMRFSKHSGGPRWIDGYEYRHNPVTLPHLRTSGGPLDEARPKPKVSIPTPLEELRIENIALEGTIRNQAIIIDDLRKQVHLWERQVSSMAPTYAKLAEENKMLRDELELLRPTPVYVHKRSLDVYITSDDPDGNDITQEMIRDAAVASLDHYIAHGDWREFEAYVCGDDEKVA